MCYFIKGVFSVLVICLVKIVFLVFGFFFIRRGCFRVIVVLIVICRFLVVM